MKTKNLLYILLIAGLLVPTLAVTVLADDIPMWVHQARVTYTGRSSGGPDDMSGYVHISDDYLDRVEGARVYATWTLPDGSTQEAEAVSNRQGIASFSVFVGAGDYTLCVDNVVADGFEYHSESNWVECDTFILPPYKTTDKPTK